MKNISVPRRFL